MISPAYVYNGSHKVGIPFVQEFICLGHDRKFLKKIDSGVLIGCLPFFFFIIIIIIINVGVRVGLRVI
jgi:hypothetical protein